MDLTGVNFKNSNLQRTTFNNSILDYADLSDTDRAWADTFSKSSIGTRY